MSVENHCERSLNRQAPRVLSDLVRFVLSALISFADCVAGGSADLVHPRDDFDDPVLWMPSDQLGVHLRYSLEPREQAGAALEPKQRSIV